MMPIILFSTDKHFPTPVCFYGALTHPCAPMLLSDKLRSNGLRLTPRSSFVFYFEHGSLNLKAVFINYKDLEFLMS